MSMPSKKVVPIITAIGIVAVTMLLNFAASAGAQSPGLDQYVESIPGAGGNHTTDKGEDGGGGGGSGSKGDGGGGGYSSGPTVGSSQLDALRSQGSEGERAAAALEATSGSSDSKGSDSKGSDSKGSDSKGSEGGGRPDRGSFDSSEAEGKAPVEAVLSSMFGGTGIVLPLIMLAVLVAGLVIAARKRATSIDD
ncbi:MAG: hypothetical protein R2718_10200 [Solirubrobacterales bacterium]